MILFKNSGSLRFFEWSMQNSIKFRGYTALIDYDAHDHIFVGRVLGMSEQLVFHGASVDELHADFEFAVGHYISECKKEGRRPTCTGRANRHVRGSASGNGCAGSARP